MGKYSKAIAAFIVSAVGLTVAFGYMTEPQAKELTVMLTAGANLVAVWFFRNA